MRGALGTAASSGCSCWLQEHPRIPRSRVGLEAAWQSRRGGSGRAGFSHNLCKLLLSQPLPAPTAAAAAPEHRSRLPALPAQLLLVMSAPCSGLLLPQETHLSVSAAVQSAEVGEVQCLRNGWFECKLAASPCPCSGCW